MSTYVVDWALTEAPTADLLEFAILTVMAERADRDGCGVFPSVPTIAKACHSDPKTVRTRIGNMVKRRLLAPGDPTSPGALKYLKIRADNRPNLYDILVPAEWYSPKMLAAINEEREMMGREPLTSENRPPMAPAPPKKARSDKGKARPERRKKQPATETAALPAETATGGLVVPPCDDPETTSESVSEADSRGDYKSGRGGTTSPVAGGLQVPQTCKGNLSEEPVKRGGGNAPPPPHPPAHLTAGDVENVVTAQLDFSTQPLTACAELGAAAESASGDESGAVDESGKDGAGVVGGEVCESARESVMAQVRASYPSKVQSRITSKPSQRRPKRSNLVSATSTHSTNSRAAQAQPDGTTGSLRLGSPVGVEVSVPATDRGLPL